MERYRPCAMVGWVWVQATDSGTVRGRTRRTAVTTLFTNVAIDSFNVVSECCVYELCCLSVRPSSS